MLFDLTPAQVRAALGAARALAAADGTYDDHERRLIEAAARTLGYTGPIDGVDADDVANVVTDPAIRLRIVQAMIVVAMIDGAVTDAEHEVISFYARALAIDEPRIANLKQIAHGHSRMLYIDLWRKSAYLQDAAKKAWHDKGLRGLYEFFGSVTGVAHNAELAARYRALGNLPRGTLGREYFEHMVERGFPFPGEQRGFAEELVKHDLAHVLGGYDTEPTGECEVIGFISGFMKHDPFGYLFMIVVHMQLGVNVFTGSPVDHMILPVDKVVAAIARGAKVTRDLYDPAWDFWAELSLPLAEVRHKYGIA